MAITKSKISKYANRVNVTGTGKNRSKADLMAAYDAGTSKAASKWQSFKESAFCKNAKSVASKAWDKTRTFFGNRQVELLAAYAAIKEVKKVRKEENYAKWLSDRGYNVVSPKRQQEIADLKTFMATYDGAPLYDVKDIKGVIGDKDTIMKTGTALVLNVDGSKLQVVNKDALNLDAISDPKKFMEMATSKEEPVAFLSATDFESYIDDVSKVNAITVAPDTTKNDDDVDKTKSDAPMASSDVVNKSGRVYDDNEWADMMDEMAFGTTVSTIVDASTKSDVEPVSFVDKITQLKEERDTDTKKTFEALVDMMAEFDPEKATQQQWTDFLNEYKKAGAFIKSKNEAVLQAQRDVPDDFKNLVNAANADKENQDDVQL